MSDYQFRNDLSRCTDMVRRATLLGARGDQFSLD